MFSPSRGPGQPREGPRGGHHHPGLQLWCAGRHTAGTASAHHHGRSPARAHHGRPPAHHYWAAGPVRAARPPGPHLQWRPAKQQVGNG